MDTTYKPGYPRVCPSCPTPKFFKTPATFSQHSCKGLAAFEEQGGACAVGEESFQQLNLDRIVASSATPLDAYYHALIAVLVHPNKKMNASIQYAPSRVGKYRVRERSGPGQWTWKVFQDVKDVMGYGDTRRHMRRPGSRGHRG